MGRKVAVIVNPTSGKGKGGKSAPEVGALLHGKGLEAALLIGSSAEEVLGMARHAVDDGVDAVIAAGGDGTVNLAVQAVADTQTPLGVIPLGTGNDNANLLGLPKNISDCVDVIADFNVRAIDAARIQTADGETNWFMGVMSSGFDSLVTERANKMTWPKGDARYIIAMLAEFRTFQPLDYRVTLDGEEHLGKGMLVAIGNGESYGGGMQVCAGAKPDDGLLTLTWLSEASKLTFLRTFPTVYKGTHIHKTDLVKQFHARKIHIEAPEQIAYADGERMGLLPADVEAVPGALRVIVPAGSTLGS